MDSGGNLMTKARDLANAADVLDDVSATELSYVNGVTSSIQTQLNNISGSKAQPTEPSSPTDGMIWVDTDGSTTDANFIPKTLTSTTGDIIYASSANTPARLGIGSTSQVLTVSGGVPTWAAPAAGGGMTLIKRASFSNVANTGTTFDDVFTSSYETYFINIEQIYSASAGDDLHMQLRYAGPTTQAAAYYMANYYANYIATSMSFQHSNNASQWLLSDNSGDSADTVSAQLYLNNVGNISERALINGAMINSNKITAEIFAGNAYTARLYTGFLLKSSSSNITGTVTVFGVNKS